jgi:hypothetical protein
MGGSCNTNGVEERLVQGIGEKTRRNEKNRKIKTWVGANIKVDFGEIGCGGVHCIGLAQDRDKSRALVDVVMNLQVP